jgi:hypothetical protein
MNVRVTEAYLSWINGLHDRVVRDIQRAIELAKGL